MGFVVTDAQGNPISPERVGYPLAAEHIYTHIIGFSLLHIIGFSFFGFLYQKNHVLFNNFLSLCGVFILSASCYRPLLGSE